MSDFKPILVTGGAKGLGKEICYHLAQQGHDLIVHYRKSEKEAAETVETCRTEGVRVEKIEGDFATELSLELFIREYLNRFPHTKGIVNNVGNYLIAPLMETEKKQWHALFQTNFFAPVLLTQTLIPSIQKEEGSIVNIGVSGLHPTRPFVKVAAYASTKSALWFYTRSLAEQLAPSGVNVNMVSPGYLETTTGIDPDRFPKPLVKLSEVARVVAFLCDKQSRSITAQNIEVA